MNQYMRKTFLYGALLTCTIAFSFGALAAEGETKPKGKDEPPSATDSNFFKNLGIGGAVGWTHNLGRTRVETVSAPNGIVRIDQDKNNLARLWVETHTWVHEWDLIDKDTKKYRWGHGPFVGVAVGSNFVDAVGAGWMIGRRYGDSNTSFNFAIGGALELNAKVLGDGVNANQPLPPGETTVRTKTTSVGSLLVLFSIAYDVFGSPSTPAKTETRPAVVGSDAETRYDATTIPLEDASALTLASFVGPKRAGER